MKKGLLSPVDAVAIVTADCVPVLLCAGDGISVAALHAGWRGLSAGVLENGVAELRALGADACLAAIGLTAGPCCYEVDAPVIDALSAAYPERIAAHLRTSRPGHAWIDLAGLARDALIASGIAADDIDALSACTLCDAKRFHSHRRDGAAAGRMRHWVAAS